MKRRKGVAALAAGLVALLAGGALVFAHGGGWRHGAPGSDEMAEHFQVHVKHVLAEVDATPEQRTRIEEIVQAATRDLKALHAQHAGARAAFHEVIAAPSVDRVRLEQLRAQHLAAIDEASKRCLAALADAAEVLTPEQRAELAAKMAKRHAGHAGVSHGG
jgi:Spy/CpxP family protein refolding chaperone